MTTMHEVKASIRYLIGTEVRTISLNSGNSSGNRRVSSIHVKFSAAGESVFYGISRDDIPQAPEEFAEPFMDVPSKTIQEAKRLGYSPGKLGIYLPDEKEDVDRRAQVELEIFRASSIEKKKRDLTDYINGQKARIEESLSLITKYEKELSEIDSQK